MIVQRVRERATTDDVVGASTPTREDRGVAARYVSASYPPSVAWLHAQIGRWVEDGEAQPLDTVVRKTLPALAAIVMEVRIAADRVDFERGVRAGVEAEREARDTCGCGDVLCAPEERPSCETCRSTSDDDLVPYPSFEEVVGCALIGRPAWIVSVSDEDGGARLGT